MQEAVRVLEEIKLANFPEKWYTLRMTAGHLGKMLYADARSKGVRLFGLRVPWDGVENMR